MTALFIWQDSSTVLNRILHLCFWRTMFTTLVPRAAHKLGIHVVNIVCHGNSYIIYLLKIKNNKKLLLVQVWSQIKHVQTGSCSTRPLLPHLPVLNAHITVNVECGELGDRNSRKENPLYSGACWDASKRLGYGCQQVAREHAFFFLFFVRHEAGQLVGLKTHRKSVHSYLWLFRVGLKGYFSVWNEWMNESLMTPQLINKSATGCQTTCSL